MCSVDTRPLGTSVLGPVQSQVRVASPCRRGQFALKRLLEATLSTSGVEVDMMVPRFSTPYSTAISMKSLTFDLISAKAPNTKGLKFSYLNIFSKGPSRSGSRRPEVGNVLEKERKKERKKDGYNTR
jgi:hypothetical protein